MFKSIRMSIYLAAIIAIAADASVSYASINRHLGARIIPSPIAISAGIPENSIGTAIAASDAIQLVGMQLPSSSIITIAEQTIRSQIHATQINDWIIAG